MKRFANFISGFVLIVAASISVSSAASAIPAGGGCTACFSHLPPELKSLPGPGRLEKELLRDLLFTDSRHAVWKANAGDHTDGASIPSIFLPLIGPRFEPDFLPAAIIHDHYTDELHRVRTWTATAHVFYEAMIANHTPKIKGKLMYYAVFAFGPHWAYLKPGVPCGPRCVNLTARERAEARIMGKSVIAHPRRAGTEFYFEPEHAEAADLSEMEQVKAKIAAAEESRAPMNLADLQAEAARRHPQNMFIAAAAR